MFSTGRLAPTDTFVRFDSASAPLAHARSCAQHNERLVLDSVRLSPWLRAALGFMPYFRRSADDLGAMSTYLDSRCPLARTGICRHAFRMMQLRHRFALALGLALIGRVAQAQDEFASVRCTDDVAKALVGREAAIAPVAEIEAKHRDIGLKIGGGTAISNGLSLTFRRLSGSEYAVLQTRRIRDVIDFPEHSRRRPGFVGTCTANGTPTPSLVIAVLENAHTPRRQQRAANDTTGLLAIVAWSIDAERGRFVEFAAGSLRCPRSLVLPEDRSP